MVLALAVVAVTACLHGSGVQGVAPGHLLSPTAAESPQKGDGPFRVVFSGPRGEASEVSELTVVFNRPLRVLELAGSKALANAETDPARDIEAPPPIRLTPNIAGRWQWVGTRALLFVPTGARLPQATSFQVLVPADTRALDGTRLGTAHSFEFSTPRPRLVRSTPGAGDRTLSPGTRFELFFNQAIDPGTFKRVATLHARRGKSTTSVRFDAERVDPEKPKRMRIVPSLPLPIDSDITFEIGAELASQEGPLRAGQPTKLEFRTYGPLAVAGHDCDRETPNRRCAPGGGVSLTFSNPVRFSDVKRLLQIEPPIKLRWDDSNESGEVTYVNLVGPFKAGAAYVLRVGSELRDRYGQKLGRAHTERVAFDDYWPTLQIGVGGDYFEPSASRPIPIASVNVHNYELLSIKLKPEQVLGLQARDAEAQTFSALDELPGLSRRRVSPKAAKNQLAKEFVNPDTLLGAAKPGVFAVGTRYSDPRGPRGLHSDVKIVQVTDLALSAKLSRHGSLVWVTRLSTGQPIAGARVEIQELRGKARGYTTDSRGFASIPARDFAPNFYEQTKESGAVLFAKSGEDWAFRRVSDYLDPWRTNVPTDLSGEQRSYGLMFTERGIYRPGDVVEVKGIVRLESPAGNALVTTRSIDVVLRSPEGDESVKQSVKLTRFGTFALKMRVPRTAQLGSWSLVTKGLPNGEISDYLEVLEYRPAEFKVAAESNRPAFVRGDNASFTAHADYLFGAPMAKAEVRWNLTRAVSAFAPPASDGFVTDASAFVADLEDQSLRAGEILHGLGKLDARGQVQVNSKLELPGQRTPELVSLDAEVTDLTRQALSGSTSAIVHPAEFYVGLQTPEDYFVAAPGQVTAKVLAFSPQGQKLTGKKVKVELVERRWTLARQEVNGDELHAISKPIDRVVGSCNVTTAALPSACNIELRQGGYYLLYASSRDARGNLAEAASSLYAIGAKGAAFADKDDHSLSLVPNKKQYLAGDVARILVKSPFQEAEALVTVERAGIYRSERVTLRGPTPTINVKVTDDLRPNAFVGVHLIRPRTRTPASTGSAVGQPTYRVGYAELDIDPEARRLKVQIRPSKTDLLPGEELGVELLVKDSSGKPAQAELTVYAVDEGVLTLIGYKTPDPIPVFTAARALQVATLESRSALARVSIADLGALVGLEKGLSGGGGGEGAARRDFRQSAYFNPAVVSDAEGKASVHFKLPESLTTYRLMAVAVTNADAYGFAASNVTTSKRLMARPALPRFFRAGDSVQAGVVITAKHFGPASVNVRAQLTGLLLEDEPTKKVQLPRDGSVEVRFRMRAKSAGKARLRFDVAAESSETRGGSKALATKKDAVEVVRDVQLPSELETVALYGKTESAAREQLGDLSAIRRDVGSLELSVASTALVGLETGIEQLVDYPYGCSEQLSSRLMPLLPLRDLARDFGLSLGKGTSGIIERTVADLLSRQRGDGGFGMWPDSEESAPWVSAYVLWTLHQAKQRGVALPEAVLVRGRDYVRRYLANLDSGPLYLPTAAFIVDVLAESGAPDPGYVTRLYEQRQKLPLFARAFLLHAMAISKHHQKTLDGFVRELENQLRIAGNSAFAAENLGDQYAVLLDSPARTSALILRALMAARPNHELGDELARGLLGVRRGGTWRSTQETTFALLALDAYRKAQERATPDYVARVWFGETELFNSSMSGRNTGVKRESVPMLKLDERARGKLVFQKEGEGTLFYEARLRYARSTLPATALERGFSVQKSWRAVRPEELAGALRTIPERGSSRFTGGDLILTDLIVVSSSPREFVVIDDPLPAGFEAVDARLSTTSRSLDVASSGGEVGAVDCTFCDEESDDAIAHQRAFLDSWHRRELRDDRALFFVDHMAAGMYHYRYLARATTLGSFVVPPTRVEQMYVPETFGRTSASRVEVR